MFQSSPFPKEGRYPTRPDNIVTGELFQSSPFPKEGRYSGLRYSCCAITCFNPRPSRRKGATALTKTHDFPRGLPDVGANLSESPGDGDNGLVSPDEISFQFVMFSSTRSHAVFVSTGGSRSQN